MASEYHVTADDHVFVGERKDLSLPVYADHAATTPVDVAGWALSWALRKHDASATALIEKSTEDSPPGIAVTGTFNADPLVNTQRVVISLDAGDTLDLVVSPVVNIKAGTYRHALMRTDVGNESVLTYGDFTLQRATVP